jgi:regulatory protein
MSKPKRRTPEPKADLAELERITLRRLDRADATVDAIRRLLRSHCRRAGLGEAEADLLIEPLLARYQASGLLDDARYAAAAVHGQRRRGASRRAIQHKLSLRGVDAAATRSALEVVDGDNRDAELVAAVAFVRRRRLGPHRPAADRESYRKRDLAALARAGFDFETARRALGFEGTDDESTF